MTKLGAPKDARLYVLCERCSAVKETRRKRMCDACGRAKVAELAQERQRLREFTPSTLEARRRGRWKAARLPSPTRPCPGACEICNKTDVVKRSARIRALALDHCHATGKFRGWLCFRCNVGLARFGDSLDGIRRAYEYLQRAYEESKE